MVVYEVIPRGLQTESKGIWTYFRLFILMFAGHGI
jgi:hypothetical protein